MASTIRTYRAPAASPTNYTLVDTETDSNDGSFSVTVDTTGWSAGNYEITVTREDTTNGYTESLHSNAKALTVSVAGNSDAFTEASPPVALATHNSAWQTAATAFPVGGQPTTGLNCVTGGYVQIADNYTVGGAMYSTSTSDISQISRISGLGAPDGNWGPCVRASGTNYGYFLRLDGYDTGYYPMVRITKDDGSGTSYTTNLCSKDDITPVDATATITLRLVASGTSPVTFQAYINGTEVTSWTEGAASDSSPNTGTHPGFIANVFSGVANISLDNWQDT